MDHDQAADLSVSGGFQFEQEFIDSLRCIPMVVRLKLDSCGVKLKLSHWHQFSRTERQSLVAMPCETEAAVRAYRDHLQALVTHHTGQPAKEIEVIAQPPWQQLTIPESVQQQVVAHALSLTTEHWQALTVAQRFALIKLSRPSHENRNFVPAMQEFGLMD